MITSGAQTFSIPPRKWQTLVERVDSEAGQQAFRPITRVVALAVFENVLASGNNGDDLAPLINASAEIGAELARLAIDNFEGPVVAYGKAAIIGVDGDVEHAAAVLHPKLGAPMRAAIGGGKALIPSTAKVASAGASIDMPLGHKDDPWSFDEIDTITVSISDSPRPKEIMLAIAYSDGGRPNPRLPT